MRYDEPTDFESLAHQAPCEYESGCPFHVAQGNVINLTDTRDPCAQCSITIDRETPYRESPPKGFVRTDDIP